MNSSSSNFGFVYATSGRGYADLAVVSAWSLREVAPEARIHLFTDTSIDCDHPFDHIETLHRPWFRPKFEAMIRSPFERTVYLDADTYIVADISDIFDVLEHHEFAAAPVIRYNHKLNRRSWRKELPLSVPRYNCGVIGIQNNPRVLAFLKQAEDTLISEQLDHDQSMMREMLFESDIRVVSLPYEYNFNELTMLDVVSDRFAAPRVLHFMRMRDHLAKTGVDHLTVHHLLGPERSRFLEKHRQIDMTLGATSIEPMPSVAELLQAEATELLNCLENKENGAEKAVTKALALRTF
ncbi:putative nucleotide-diphospho-sugar transferase [Cognatiyoonia sp. IB215182]|uniref:putative nucleotide-diphospho-sugar transferase n=1 Tax=Cognatiyoonia sp. IB215182 TaxID=3097353 RepID=UPI002A14668F|nr:putative nucleotide-diphospho-sugar transferase [Cognatiyoonia sp. IB215182]MDX8353319.1 putative nucleotide-diphospho-sugar transferase [Cognatiyoonia sp. IB215182]